MLSQIWKRHPGDWDLLVTQLYIWLFRVEEEAGRARSPEELHVMELFKTDGEGSVFSAEEEVSQPLRDWLNEWSSVSHKFRRTSVKPDTWPRPLHVNEKSFKPGFSPTPTSASRQLFDLGNQENFTWTEGNSIMNLIMNQESGDHWLLEVRTHWGGRLPFALELVQTARDSEGMQTSRSSQVYQKRRHDSFTRLERELLEDVSQERHDGVWLDLVRDGSPGSLVGTITGPQGSPYSGGRFQIEIILPETYPFVAPKFRFITKVWHPNVNHLTGDVCLVDVPPSLPLVKMLIHFQVNFRFNHETFTMLE